MGFAIGFDVPDQCPCGFRPSTKSSQMASGFVLNHWKDQGVVVLDRSGFKLIKDHPHIYQEPVVVDAKPMVTHPARNNSRSVVEQARQLITATAQPKKTTKQPKIEVIKSARYGAGDVPIPAWLLTVLASASFMVTLAGAAVLFVLAFLVVPLAVTSALYGPLRFWALGVSFVWHGGVTIPVSVAIAVTVLVPQYRRLAWRYAVLTTKVLVVFSVVSAAALTVWWLI